MERMIEEHVVNARMKLSGCTASCISAPRIFLLRVIRRARKKDTWQKFLPTVNVSRSSFWESDRTCNVWKSLTNKNRSSMDSRSLQSVLSLSPIVELSDENCQSLVQTQRESASSRDAKQTRGGAIFCSSNCFVINNFVNWNLIKTACVRGKSVFFYSGPLAGNESRGRVRY